MCAHNIYKYYCFLHVLCTTFRQNSDGVKKLVVKFGVSFVYSLPSKLRWAKKTSCHIWVEKSEKTCLENLGTMIFERLGYLEVIDIFTYF